MCKLFRILATASSDVIEPYAIPQNIGLQSRLVAEVKAKTTGTCTVKYNHLDGSNPTIYTAASAATAVQAAMNVANTSDINSINLTVLPDDGSDAYYLGVDPYYIEQVLVDSANSNYSYVRVQNLTQTQLNNLHCNDTQAAIISAANA
jgi:hypothetical protein